MTRPLPAILARSEILFAPAKTVRLTPGRLHDVMRRRFVAATAGDVTDLRRAAVRAAEASRDGRAALARTAGPQTGHEPQARLLTRSQLISASAREAAPMELSLGPTPGSVVPQL